MALSLRIGQCAVERRSNIDVEQRPIETLHNCDPARSHACSIALSTTIRLGKLKLLVE